MLKLRSVHVGWTQSVSLTRVEDRARIEELTRVSSEVHHVVRIGIDIVDAEDRVAAFRGKGSADKRHTVCRRSRSMTVIGIPDRKSIAVCMSVELRSYRIAVAPENLIGVVGLVDKSVVTPRWHVADWEG